MGEKQAHATLAVDAWNQWVRIFWTFLHNVLQRNWPYDLIIYKKKKLMKIFFQLIMIRNCILSISWIYIESWRWKHKLSPCALFWLHCNCNTVKQTYIKNSFWKEKKISLGSPEMYDAEMQKSWQPLLYVMSLISNGEKKPAVISGL